MSRLWTILSILAVASFFTLSAQPGQAQSLQGEPEAQSDVNGMDHSKLNHGVLGHVAYQTGGELPQASASKEVRGSDPDVIGMDHSKLNHGVPGVARLAANSLGEPAKVALVAVAPASDTLVWLPPEEIRPRIRLGMNSESRPRSE
jgi:hypothetical protein